MTSDHTPLLINLRQADALLEMAFSNGQIYHLSSEYLRVFSPSAEFRAQSKEGMKRFAGKKYVNIAGIDPVGNYAIKIFFDDGHASGIYTWDMLYDLGRHQDVYWQEYLDCLADAGLLRDPVKN